MLESEEGGDEAEDEAADAMGVPGLDKVEALARALVELEGISVTNSQAEKLKSLYVQLVDYDKKPVIFERRPRLEQQDGVSSKKNKSGHTGLETMRRSLNIPITDYILISKLGLWCY